MSAIQVPRSLIVVAILFIVQGIYAIYRTATHWSDGYISLPLDAVSILIGVGLLRRWKRWRSFAVRWLWFAIVLSVAFLTWFISYGGQATVTGIAAARSPHPNLLVAGYIAFVCLLMLGGIGVLTSRKVVSFYEDKSAS